MFNLGIPLLGIMIITIGLGAAADVPFVFDETSVDVASYTSAQLEQTHISSPDLAGVPIVSSPSDTAILAFPVTGGGSTPEGTTDKKVGELKNSLSARVEPDNSVVRHEAVVLAAKYPGDRTIDQISSIYSYLKNGADSNNGWSYVADTRGIDYFMYANETLEIGKDAGCAGAGDCDDFAILMSALIESIGGTTRIILARNNTTGGHAYTEVYLGQLDAQNSQVEDIISWLKEKFDTDKIYTHIDTDTKDVWLNLDWGPDEKGNTHPGGPFYQGDKHYVLCIRDTFVKTPLKLPEISNKLPKLVSLIPDKSTSQDTGTVVTWTAEAKDPENDEMLYRFFLNDEPVTRWIKDNTWTWKTTDFDIGKNQIEVRIRDGRHSGPDGFDGSEVTNFDIIKLKPRVPENRPPVLTSLNADRASPQDSSTSITWTANALDPDGDQILYRFFLNGWPVTDYTTDNVWATCAPPGGDFACENRTSPNEGKNQIEVRVRDGKHAGPYGYDANKMATFTITTPVVTTNETSLTAWDWNDKAHVLEGQGKYDEALKCFDKATELDPKNIGILENEGYMLERRGMYDKAIECFDKAIEACPECDYPWLDKGSALHIQGKYEDAIICFDKAIEILNRGEAWQRKGDALKALDREIEANAAFEKAIELSGGDQLPDLIIKGMALRALGRTAESSEAFAKAKELGYTGT